MAKRCTIKVKINTDDGFESYAEILGLIEELY
jgi:hypothetical protein